MKVVATEKAPKALGPYSQGYVHNGVLYTAGQIAINPEVNDVEATTIEAQTEQVCKNLGEVLKEAGTSFDKVLKTTCFLCSIQRSIWKILYIKTGKKLCCSKDTSKGSSV